MAEQNNTPEAFEERDDIITLTDEEGNETDFQVIDGVEYNGKTYLMLIEAEAADDDSADAMILRLDEEGEEEILSTVDDEDEFNAVAKLFEEQGEEGDYDVDPADGN